MFRSSIFALFRSVVNKNIIGLCDSSGRLIEELKSKQLRSTNFVRTYASKSKGHGKGDKGKSDLIKCPEKTIKTSCDKLDLSQPKIGYYDYGYCRPPCKPKRMSCPKDSGKGKKAEKGKKKHCCHIKTSKFKINPCKFASKKKKSGKSKKTKKTKKTKKAKKAKG